MAITLPAVMPHIVAMVVNRGDTETDFDERDRGGVLDMLRPHLAQAYRFARERERVAAMLDVVGGVLRADGTYAIVLEDPPRELTPGALVMLYRFFGRPGVADALPGRVSRWLAPQRTRRDLVRPIVSERDGRQLVMRFVPGGPIDAVRLNAACCPEPRRGIPGPRAQPARPRCCRCSRPE